MNDAKKTFARNLKYIMEHDSLTERDVYCLFWIDEVKELQNFLGAVQLPSINTADRIAQYANVSVFALFHKDLSAPKKNPSEAGA